MPNAADLRGQLRTAWPLYLALAAIVAAYGQAMNSPLYGDDYFYLYAARELSFPEYAKVAFTPWGNEPLLPFTRDFWRPLPFLWFEVAEPVFGDNPFPYHLANLGIHMVSAVLVWVLAARLDARLVVRAVATLLFALYPGSFEAVTWLSSVNSLGLPFALGSWIAFLAATSPPGPRSDTAETRAGPRRSRWPMLVLSALLLALALCCRESGTALVPAMTLWYLLVQRRSALLEWRTYLPLAPFVAVGIAYFLVRTRLLTEPFANSEIYAVDSSYLQHWWYYAKNAFLPFRDPVTGWRDQAQDVAGAVFVALPWLALRRQRWDFFALLVGLLVSTLPYGAALLGVGLRYFYFSTPVLALIAGIAAADVLEWLRPRVRLVPARALFPGLAIIVAVAGVYSTSSRIENWIEVAPERQQAWVDGLQAAHPELLPGGALYCANVPLILAVFDGANLGPTVRWYYPEVGEVIYFTGQGTPILGPDDRFYDPLSSRATNAEP